MQQKLIINRLYSVVCLLSSVLGTSTSVENPLQINLFMQNKPNFRKAKMNVNLTLTKDYRKKDDFSVRINKPNFRNCQNEHKYLYHKGLWKWTSFRPRKNKPKQTQNKACPERSRMGQFKPNQHYVADIYFWGLPGEVLIEIGLDIKRLLRPPMAYLQRYALWNDAIILLLRAKRSNFYFLML